MLLNRRPAVPLAIAASLALASSDSFTSAFADCTSPAFPRLAGSWVLLPMIAMPMAQMMAVASVGQMKIIFGYVKIFIPLCRTCGVTGGVPDFGSVDMRDLRLRSLVLADSIG